MKSWLLTAKSKARNLSLTGGTSTRCIRARSAKMEDMRAIAEKVEQELGTETLRSMHCHFSAIEFGSQGEKSHHTLDEKRYGPDFRWLAEIIADFGLHPTIICETPILDVDARRMQATLKEVLANKQKNL